jgi:hypothetical protein
MHDNIDPMIYGQLAVDAHDKAVEQRLIDRLTAAWQGPPEQLQYYIAKMKGVE